MDKIVESIQATIDNETRDLSRENYKQVLEDLYSDIKSRLDALDEDEQE